MTITRSYLVTMQNFILLAIALNLSGYFLVEGMLMSKVCKGVDLTSVEKHMMNMKKCVEEFGVKDMLDIETSKMACFGKCVMTKGGIIDEKGMPHHENIKKMVKDDMPPVVHAELDKQMDACLKEDSINMIDPADESCMTYIPLAMCMHNAFTEVCES